jgi:outer membrane receptor protein involved in Fe transport
LIGVNAADKKGNVMLGVEWYTRENVLLRDRDFYHNGWYDPGSDAGGGFLQMAAWSPNTAANGNPVGLPPQSAIDAIFAGTPGYTPGKVTNVTDLYFNPDGSPFVITGARGYNGPISDASTPWDQNLSTGFGGVRKIPNGDLGQIGTQQGFASTPLERHSAFGRAHYDISDTLEMFVQGNYSSVDVTTTGGFPPAITVWSAAVPNDGKRYIPAALQTLLNSRTKTVNGVAGISAAADPWTLFRVLDFLGGPNTVETNSSVYQIMAGVDGHLPNRDWTWEAYVSSGHTQVDNVNFNTPSLQRYQSLVAQPNWGQGTFASGRNYSQTCTSGLPIFIQQGISQVTQDCIDAIDTRGKAQTRLGQQVIEANMQGKITDMKAGELRFSAGVSNRKNDFVYDPINDVADVSDNPIGLFASNHTKGSTEVSEVYGELLVPATKKLNFELGYRLSDYKDEAAGTTGTYKALFDWGATQKMHVRGGFQRATRAPNTAELFQGPTLLVVPFAPSDPCSYTFDHGDQPGSHLTWGNTQANTTTRLQVQQLCQALIANSDTDPTNDTTSRFGVAGTAAANNFARISPAFFPLEIEKQTGNPKVGPETADTWTLGLVLNGPGSLENLTASFDIYNIKIQDAIAPVNSLFVYQQCFNANGTSNPSLVYNDPGGWCKLIQRNVQTGERAQVVSLFVNSGTLETQGVDVQVNWRKGPFYVNSVISYLDKYDVQDVKNGAVVHVAGTFDRNGQFDYKLNSTLGYNFNGGKASVGLNWRYLPSIKDESASRNPATTISGVGSYQEFGLFAGYTLSEKTRLTLGVNNLMDKQPPIYGYTASDHNAEVTKPEYYDILGRSYYASINLSF